jgi:hypothetical protein
MIGNDRLIVVFGMAHSGTTIFTKTLLQCPEILCLRNGPQRWIYENTYLRKEKTRLIEKFLAENPTKLILLKSPWAEKKIEFFKENMPFSYYFCMVKGFKAIQRSWQKKTSFVATGLRKNKARQKKQYDEYHHYAYNFPKLTGCKRYCKILYPRMLENPEATFRRVNRFLGITFRFDPVEIVPGGDVKKGLRG